VTRSFTVNQKMTVTLAPAPGGPFSFHTGGISLATADFNGDGISDLAVADSLGITFAMGDGAGGFTTTGTYFSGGMDAVNTVAAGDFNGDGFPDVATPHGGDSGVVTMLLGDGKGGFTPATGSPFPVGAYPLGLVVGDFNGDGIQDLATFNKATDDVSVLLGNGLGGFVAAAGGAAGFEPQALVVGDYDGDGIQDLAVAGLDYAVVLLGDRLGGFKASSASPFAVGPTSITIATGDFNRDGSLDLAFANLGGNSVTVVLGNGIGGFSPASRSPFGVGASPYSVTVGDFNGDGIPDLATGNINGVTVTLFIGKGQGGFTTGQTIADPIAIFVAAGDFNADGVQDLAVVSANAGTVTVLLGAPVSTTTVLSTTSPATIAAGQTVSLTATVSETGASGTPTGSVTILDGSTVLGTASQTASPYTFTATGLGGGSHTLTAVYTGDAQTSMSNAIVIEVVATQTISFGGLSDVVLGSGNLTLAATASSGQAVSYTSTTLDVCTVSTSGTVTILAVGTCSIVATQPGNSVLCSASVTQSFSVVAGATCRFGGDGSDQSVFDSAGRYCGPN
jgi:Bacterial Ig-like domain (group 3)/FG-GAP-like repeat